MEQHQSRVRFSLGTKLLCSVLALILVSIFFLDFSTILLVTQDKRAYTFQSQSSEAVLVGKEFVNLTTYAMDSLRVALGTPATVSPAVASGTQSPVQSIVNN